MQIKKCVEFLMNNFKSVFLFENLAEDLNSIFFIYSSNIYFGYSLFSLSISLTMRAVDFPPYRRIFFLYFIAFNIKLITYIKKLQNLYK